MDHRVHDLSGSVMLSVEHQCHVPNLYSWGSFKNLGCGGSQGPQEEDDGQHW